MATQIWLNTGSASVLLPDGAKPLFESVLTSHQRDPLAFTNEQFKNNVQVIILYNECVGYIFKITVAPPRGQWVNYNNYAVLVAGNSTSADPNPDSRDPRIDIDYTSTLHFRVRSMSSQYRSDGKGTQSLCGKGTQSLPDLSTYMPILI